MMSPSAAQDRAVAVPAPSIADHSRVQPLAGGVKIAAELDAPIERDSTKQAQPRHGANPTGNSPALPRRSAGPGAHAPRCPWLGRLAMSRCG
jgi:hypothetical protein